MSTTEATAVDHWPSFSPKFYSFLGPGNLADRKGKSSKNAQRFSLSYKCATCDATVVASTTSSSNLKRHYELNHSKETFQEMLKCLEGQQRGGKKRKLHDDNMMQPSVASLFKAREGSSTSTVSQKTVDELVINYISRRLEPFALVEDVDFQELVAGLSGGRKVPDRRQVTTSIKTNADHLKEHLKVILRDVPFVSTAVDCWTARHKSFIGMTCHWLDQNLNRQNAVLACRRIRGSHTYDVLANEIQQVHEEFLIAKKVTATVTDNASNFVKAFREFGATKIGDMAGDDEEMEDIMEFIECDELYSKAEQEYNLPPHHRCAAHSLNLVAAKDSQEALKVQKYADTYTSFFRTVKDVCGKQSRSTLHAESIEQITGRKFTIPNETRWNSSFDCVKSFVKVEEDKSGTLESVCQALGIQPFRPNEKGFMKEYYKVMEPVAQALDKLQGDKVCYMGMLLPTICVLRLTLERLRDDPSDGRKLVYCQPLVNALLDGIKKRFDHFFEHEDTIVSSCLHPGFKMAWVDTAKKDHVLHICHKRIGNLDEEGQGEENVDDFFAILMQKTEKSSKTLDNFLNSDLSRSFAQVLQNAALKQQFIKFNTALPSSASVERLFSIAGRIFVPNRSRISDENFESQLLLRVNRNL